MQIMKRKAALFILLSVTSMAFSQISVTKLTTTFEYDLNGNVTARKSAAKLPDAAVGGGATGSLTDKIDATWDGKIFTVHVKGDDAMPVTISLYDTSPVLLKTEEFCSRTHSVDLSEYPDGIYMFGIKADEQNCSMKVIKAE